MDVDAIVVDIDGVLVDTSESYHRAIVDTVEAVYGETVDLHETQAFKNAGRFNNDWRVTEAIALFVLARQEGYRSDVTDFTTSIENQGGGIDGAKRVLETDLDPETRETVFDRWDPGALRRTFQWLYLGPERYDLLEDEPRPEEPPQPAGYMDDEPLLISSNTVDWLTATYPLGILTGRPAAEAAVALDRVGIALPNDLVITMDDWSGGKPDPEGLIRLAGRLDASRLAYVGDEIDDVRTAVNADNVDERRYFAVGVLSGGLSGNEGRDRLRAAGADAVMDSIESLPELVAGPQAKGKTEREG